MLKDMADEEICLPAGLTFQEAQLVRPADLRELHNMAAHTFSLPVCIEAMRENNAEKPLYIKIMQLKSGGKVV